MTAAQSLKIYEILGKYFQNPADAHIVVTEIEQIIEQKIEDKKNVLATKADLHDLTLKVVNLEVNIEKRFNQLTIWIISMAIALSGIIIAVNKL